MYINSVTIRKLRTTDSKQKEVVERNMDKKEMLSLLVVGKTGNGKSSTGNTIIGLNAFKAQKSMSSVTKSCDIFFGMLNGRRVRVVDTPGCMDTDSSPVASFNNLSQSLQEAVFNVPGGYHAILLVVSMGRFTPEEYEAVMQLKRSLGEEFIKHHCILIMTHADCFDPEEEGMNIEEWIKAQGGVFKDILNECGNRIVPFNNRETDVERKKAQLEKLYHLLESIVQNYGCYHKGHFETASNARSSLRQQLTAFEIKEKSMNTLDEIDLELIEIEANENEKEALLQLKDIKCKIEKNIYILQNQNSEDVKDSFRLFNIFKSLVDLKIEKLVYSIEMKERKGNLQEQNVNINKFEQRICKLEDEKREDLKIKRMKFFTNAVTIGRHLLESTFRALEFAHVN